MVLKLIEKFEINRPWDWFHRLNLKLYRPYYGFETDEFIETTLAKDPRTARAARCELVRDSVDFCDYGAVRSLNYNFSTDLVNPSWPVSFRQVRPGSLIPGKHEKPNGSKACDYKVYIPRPF